MVLGSNAILCLGPLGLLHLQPCRGSHALLVLYRMDGVDLCLRLYPVLYLLFPFQKASCFFCFNVSFDLPAFVCLCSVYEWILLVFNGLYRHSDRLCGDLFAYPVIPYSAIPLQVYPFVYRGFCVDGVPSAEYPRLAFLQRSSRDPDHVLRLPSRDGLCRDLCASL